MVQAAAITRLLEVLGRLPVYRVFNDAVTALRSTLENATQQEVVFFAPSNAALAAAGMALDGAAAWAALDPEQVLFHVVALPAGTLSAPEPALRQLSTLSGQQLAVRTSCAGLVVPLLSTAERPEPLQPYCLGHGARLCFLQYGDVLAPTYTTLAPTWPAPPTLPTLLQALQAQPAVSRFAAAAAAELAVALAQPGLYTVLAPTDAALQAMAAALNVPLQAFLASLRPADFVLLGVHAPPAEAVRYVAATATGWDVTVSAHGGVGRYNQAAVLPAASSPSLANGALYVLDAVLWRGVGRSA
jgi:uncharacterized surface protein with fasciclin (FAS1) repeats